jgi:hypothetical protein
MTKAARPYEQCHIPSTMLSVVAVSSVRALFDDAANKCEAAINGKINSPLPLSACAVRPFLAAARRYILRLMRGRLPIGFCLMLAAAPAFAGATVEQQGSRSLREGDVLDVIAQGRSNKEIARAAASSPSPCPRSGTSTHR